MYGTLDLSSIDNFNGNSGKIIVYGTLITGKIIQDEDTVDPEVSENLENSGEIIVADWCGTFTRGYYNYKSAEAEHVDHYYIEGICGCGAKEPSGFTLSGGSWWIIGIGAVVILGGIAAAVIVGKKRKKA